MGGYGSHRGCDGELLGELCGDLLRRLAPILGKGEAGKGEIAPSGFGGNAQHGNDGLGGLP